jgi:sugar-specific transcriptional regulator TrmB
MSFEHRLKLEQLGLSPAEAQIYLAVLHHGPLAASAIASETGVPRTGVYPTLCSLVEKGLIEGGLGHRSKFTAVAPEEALQGLIAREEQTLSERQQVAKELTAVLPRLPADAESALDDSVQVIRTPQLIGERLHRLQLEAKRLVEGIVKAPILVPRSWDLAQRKAMKQGVHYKALYERAALDDPQIAPYIDGWLAGGEEARVFDGELPYKFFVFDQEVVVSTLVKRSGHPTALLVRHAPYARSMSILFNFFWNQSKPLATENRKAISRSNRTLAEPATRTDRASQRISHNGRPAKSRVSKSPEL